MSYTPTEWESTDVVTATRMNALETAVGEMNMSYTPNTWSDGDILSAEKMNALEQAVASGGGGGGSWQTVFEGSVTTTSAPMGALSPIENLEVLDANTIKVTFNGTEYTCEKNQDGSYGAENNSDFSEYPFRITNISGTMTLITESAGTYTLKIEEQQSGGSSDFSTATVTLTNPPQGGGIVEFEQSVYISDLGRMFGGGGGFSSIESSIPFVLYKGAGYANFPLKQNFTVTGDIEYDQEYGDLIIRGDGTITIS